MKKFQFFPHREITCTSLLSPEALRLAMYRNTDPTKIFEYNLVVGNNGLDFAGKVNERDFKVIKYYQHPLLNPRSSPILIHGQWQEHPEGSALTLAFKLRPASKFSFCLSLCVLPLFLGFMMWNYDVNVWAIAFGLIHLLAFFIAGWHVSFLVHYKTIMNLFRKLLFIKPTNK